MAEWMMLTGHKNDKGREGWIALAHTFSLSISLSISLSHTLALYCCYETYIYTMENSPFIIVSLLHGVGIGPLIQKSYQCVHGKQHKSECGGKKEVLIKCPHGIQRSRCVSCGGKAQIKKVCRHGRQENYCHECGNAKYVYVCPHNKQKQKCIQCRKSYKCCHKKQKSKCRKCGVTPERRHMASSRLPALIAAITST